jgi:hypothetical protein
MICKNCSANFDSKFCPECGQKGDIHRVTIDHLFHDVILAVTHADKGFLLLVKKLAISPGIVAREYVDGSRKKYFNPLSFLVITSAVMAYFSYQTGYLEALGAGGQRAGGGQMSPLWGEVERIGKNSGKELTLFLMGPLFAFITWLFFIRSRYNYAENFVLNSYILGQAALFRTLVFIPLHVIWPQFTYRLWFMFYEPVFLLYLIIAFKQFFGGNLFLIILKAILVRILFVVLFWALIFFYVYTKHLLLS